MLKASWVCCDNIYGGDTDVLEKACRVLVNITALADNKAKCGASGGVQVVLDNTTTSLLPVR